MKVIWLETCNRNARMQSDKTPPEDPLSPEKKKKEVISVYVAILCVLLIGISFVWHLVSALIANP